MMVIVSPKKLLLQRLYPMVDRWRWKWSADSQLYDSAIPMLIPENKWLWV